MGAMVAYEVALRLWAERGTALAALFVSGHAGPGQRRPRALAEASDLELIEEMALLGGTDTQAFEDTELRDLILPAIRADYRLIERHRPPSVDAAIDAPVVAYYGKQDAGVDERSIAAWSTVTRSTFGVRSFGGGHFYLVAHAQALVEDLSARLGAPRGV
jgi:pyochelin biosynthetic protein PchC